ncbi:MAG: hypothetical protein P4M11_14320 [Candidatus Pacebacteria bacterium]|nr:hypothetical protein [Candidatus Paceibacterota bacterium]
MLFLGLKELNSDLLSSLSPKWPYEAIIFATGTSLLILSLAEFWACLKENRCAILIVRNNYVTSRWGSTKSWLLPCSSSSSCSLCWRCASRAG